MFNFSPYVVIVKETNELGFNQIVKHKPLGSSLGYVSDVVLHDFIHELSYDDAHGVLLINGLGSVTFIQVFIDDLVLGLLHTLLSHLAHYFLDDVLSDLEEYLVFI